MIKRTAVIVAAILLLINVPVFPDSASSTEPVPYDKNEFPQWSKDLRRAEIVSFGSLPFVTIGVTMGYGSYLYFTGSTSSFPNPLDKSGNSFSSEEQLKIFGMSLGISCVIGIVDFIINRIININNSRRNAELNESSITVTPVYPVLEQPVDPPPLELPPPDEPPQPQNSGELSE